MPEMSDCIAFLRVPVVDAVLAHSANLFIANSMLAARKNVKLFGTKQL